MYCFLPKICRLKSAFVFLAFSCSGNSQPTFRYIEIPNTNGRSLQASAISGDGLTVVGTILRGDLPFPSGFNYVPFSWTAISGFNYLSHPDITSGFSSVEVRGISQNGQRIVGRGPISRTNPRHVAILWSNDSRGQLGDGLLGAAAISNDGNFVVGYGELPLTTFQQAYRRSTSGEVIGLGRLSYPMSYADGISGDGNVVVGACWSSTLVNNSYYETVLEAFRWTSATGMLSIANVPGSVGSSVATDASYDGSVVVGGMPRSNGKMQASRWKPQDGMVGLGVVSGDSESRAYAVSDDGRIVVGNSSIGTSWDKQNAFIWTEESGMRKLEDFMRDEYGIITGPLHFAEDISPDGRSIVGHTNFHGPSFVWVINDVNLQTSSFVFKTKRIEVIDYDVHVTITSQASKAYQLETNTNLVSGWVPIGDPVVATGTQTTLIHLSGARSPRRFYRARQIE